MYDLPIKFCVALNIHYKPKRRYAPFRLEYLSYCVLHLGLFALSLLRMLFACARKHVVG